MNIINKIAIGGVFCAAFLVLAAFGLTVKVETKPQTVSAATVSMMQINGTHGANPRLANGSIIHVTWQAPAGYNYCNTGVSPAYAGVTSWGPYMDKPTSGSYSITIHESMRFQLQCAVDRSSPMTIEDGVAVDMISGGGTGSIACSNDSQCGISTYTGSPVCQSGNVYQNYTTYTCQNPGTTNSRCVDPLVTLKLKTTCTANQTCSNGACVNQGITCSSNSDCGANGLTGSPVCQGNGVYQNYRTYTCNNAGTAASYCTNASTLQLQTTCTGNQTCSNGSCSAQGVTCSSNSDCGTNGIIGGSVCQGNSVYQNYRTYTCNNAGTSTSYCSTATTSQLQNVCSGNQTCSNGSCSTNNVCTSNSYQQCVGNAVYWFNSCGQQQGLSQQCAYNQTCSGSTCVTTGNVCTSNSYQQCVGNAVYWFNSCGQQQGLSQQCAYNQTCSGSTCTNINVNPVCSSHFSYRCSGNGVYWFDSCGNQQELYQACTGNQTCSGNICINQNNNYGNLSVNVQVRNLSTGNLNWSTSVAANPGDILQFNTTLQMLGTGYANNVTVRDTLPANLYYNNNLMVDGIANSGSIISGVNIGSITSGQTRTVSYQAQVAPAQNFVFGTTTLYDAFTATSTDAYNNSGTGSASVVVTRSGVLGATTVSTGLTNNFWVDSFFLPLVLALLGLWAYKAGILNSLGLAGWVNAKKTKYADATAQAKLQDKIAQIKNREIL